LPSPLSLFSRRFCDRVAPFPHVVGLKKKKKKNPPLAPGPPFFPPQKKKKKSCSLGRIRRDVPPPFFPLLRKQYNAILFFSENSSPFTSKERAAQCYLLFSSLFFPYERKACQNSPPPPFVLRPLLFLRWERLFFHFWMAARFPPGPPPGD